MVKYPQTFGHKMYVHIDILQIGIGERKGKVTSQ